MYIPLRYTIVFLVQPKVIKFQQIQLKKDPIYTFRVKI